MRKFWNDESGQGLTEYALIIALVAVALIAVLIVFRNSIGRVFERATNELNNAPGGLRSPDRVRLARLDGGGAFPAPSLRRVASSA